MNRLVLAQKVLRTAALAICVKGRFDAKARYKAICKAAHLQQVSQFEELLEAKLQDFFNEQLRSIAVELRKQPDSQKVFCPTGPGGGVDPTCSPGGAAAERHTNFNRWYASLTEEQQASLQGWVSSKYKDIRDYEVNGHDATWHFFNAEEDGAKYSEVSKYLNAALDVAPLYKEPVYRGLRFLEDSVAKSLSTPGTVFDLKATSSFTARKEVAQKFIAADATSKFVLLHLKNPKTAVAIGELSQESEVVGRKGTQYKVVESKAVTRRYGRLSEEGYEVIIEELSAGKLFRSNLKTKSVKAERADNRFVDDGDEYIGIIKIPDDEKVFCPTGPGGGVDPTCSPSGGRSDSENQPVGRLQFGGNQVARGQAVDETLEEWFGRKLTNDELSGLAGAPAGSTVVATVYYESISDKARIGLEWHNTELGVEAHRVLRRSYDGSLNMLNAGIEITAKGKGAGTQILVEQVNTAVGLGLTSISLLAEGPPKNGYYTWPRLGFDTSISILVNLPPELSNAKRLSDLMKTEVGRQWWKANASKQGAFVDFDLKEGSLSRKVLDEYAKEKFGRDYQVGKSPRPDGRGRSDTRQDLGQDWEGSKSDDSRVIAAKLTKAVFDPKDWDKRLVEATAPTIAVMMVRAALAQQKLMRIDIGKIAKAVKVRGGDTKSISSATAWLFKKLDDADDDSLVGLLRNFGKEGVRLATEIPRWMKTKITELLHESFSEPYWKKINETTATNIENCLARGLTSGQSIRTMANQIQAGLVTEGDTEHYAKVRAKNIAITESGHSLNGSRTTAYDHLKEVLHDKPELTKQIRRVWLSILGPTTRDAHADLDGVPEDDDGMWDLNGVMVRWPSDTSLPPSDRCQCKCSTFVQYGMDRDEARILLAEYEERVIAREQGAYGKSAKVFCPTGEGGGIDPTCSPGGSGSDVAARESRQRFTVDEISARMQEAYEESKRLKEIAESKATAVQEFAGSSDSAEWRRLIDESKLAGEEYAASQAKLAVISSVHDAHTRGTGITAGLADTLLAEDGNQALCGLFLKEANAAVVMSADTDARIWDMPRVKADGSVYATSHVRGLIKESAVATIAQNLSHKIGGVDGTISNKEMHDAVVDILAVRDSGSIESDDYKRSVEHYNEKYESAGAVGRLEGFTQAVLDNWASSSTDGNPASLATQAAVYAKFGEPVGSSGEFKRDVGGGDGHAEENGQKLYEKHSKVYDAVINEIYRDTQAQLKDAGVKEVTLFRGMSVPHDIEIGDINLKMNPISSFSMHYDTAAGFAGAEGLKDRKSAVIVAKVPSERIFAIAARGMGCLTEAEVIVTGYDKLHGYVATGSGRYGDWVPSDVSELFTELNKERK